LPECNFCNVEKIRRRAKAEGLCVSILDSPRKQKGKDVYVHADETSAFLERPEEKRAECLRGWFMSIPSHCVCD